MEQTNNKCIVKVTGRTSVESRFWSIWVVL